MLLTATILPIEYFFSEIYRMLFSNFHKSKKEIQLEYKILKNAQQNPDYFGPIYDKYYGEIFGFIYKRTAEEEVTADITSVVFYKALYNLKKFKFKGLPFSSWLYRIAINEVNQHFRNKTKETRYITAEKDEIKHIFEDLEIEENKEERIIELLNELKPGDLQLVELRFFEQCSYKEIGEIMKLTETNAKTKTFRVLKKLKQIYESKWGN